ncbi:MAG: hypothetical protein Q4F56_02025, partial [Candidatus Saccharibacteria bacterium]|nr:hypothetical protein [Candidatus Saccharibacteria bacterium]
TGTGSGREFYALYDAYSGGGTLGGQTTLYPAVAHNTALSTPLSGYMSSGSSQIDLGSYGYFWSSTWYDTWSDSYRMEYRYVGATSVSGNGSNYRRNGLSVRCVLDGS